MLFGYGLIGFRAGLGILRVLRVSRFRCFGIGHVLICV